MSQPRRGFDDFDDLAGLRPKRDVPAESRCPATLGGIDHDHRLELGGSAALGPILIPKTGDGDISAQIGQHADTEALAVQALKAITRAQGGAAPRCPAFARRGCLVGQLMRSPKINQDQRADRSAC
jgi:hypothetical protein